MTMRKTYLAVAVAATTIMGASALHAETFDATGAVQTTLAVTAVTTLDLGTLSATVTGASLADGVGALVIAPDGAITDPTDSASVNLVNLGTPTPGQGSVDMINDFTLKFPVTTTIAATDFAANAGSGIGNIVTAGVELAHESGDTTVPSLYLMHFTTSAESGGTIAGDTNNDGEFDVTQAFGETTFVFNIGATVTTKPTAAAADYQEGNYVGTFEVTAEY